jgi:hypothetical protein
VPESMALKRRASMAQENIFNTDNLIFSWSYIHYDQCTVV